MFDKLSPKMFKVLNMFLLYPDKSFHLRQVARIGCVSSSTAKRSLDELQRQGFVVEERKANLRLFTANRENQSFLQLKKLKNLEWVKKKKLVDAIVDQHTISIVLFGSYATGANSTDSDIDLLVLTSGKKPIGLKALNGVKLQIIQKTAGEFRKLEKEDNPFYTEIISTGIALFGRMPV